MARRRKSKQRSIKADDNRLRPRNPYATRTHESRKAAEGLPGKGGLLDCTHDQSQAPP
jgi:hypothetical protein